MREWKENVKVNLSLNYYERAEDVEVLFNAYLAERHLDDMPISEITVRDVQLFLDELARHGYKRASTAKLKKPFPKTVNYRELERDEIIDRCRCYKLRQQGASIKKETAEAICNATDLITPSTLKRLTCKRRMQQKQSKVIGASCERYSTKLSGTNGSAKIPFVQQKSELKKAM